MYDNRKSRCKTVLPALILVGLLGCRGGDLETRSMEQIYEQEGVPVRVETVRPTSFIQEMEFTATLTGIEESSAFAKIADRVDRITANVGDYVTKDSVIVTFPTDNPTARYSQARVQYENAAATYGRMQQYFESGGLSRQELDNATAAFRVAEANWDAVQQSVLVRAPISGVITRLNVRESDNVDDEEELFAVSRTDRLKAQVWVPESEIGNFSEGLAARAVWQGIELEGEVVQVDRSVNKRRQAFGVVVELENPQSRVKSGVTGAVSIVTYRTDSALVTARKNLLKDHRGEYVFVVNDQAAAKRYVTLGRSHLLSVEITGGLATGDQLVTEGQINLEVGARVKILNGGEVAASVETNGR